MSLITTLLTELSFSTGQRIDQTVQYIRNNGIDIGEEITDIIGSGYQGRIYATSDPTKVIKNLDMFVDIQQGVYELRELGIEHGDLHVHNIMKDKNGTHKIIDLW